jgi:hypothetical protein
MVKNEPDENFTSYHFFSKLFDPALGIIHNKCMLLFAFIDLLSDRCIAKWGVAKLSGVLCSSVGCGIAKSGCGVVKSDMAHLCRGVV